MAHSLPSDMISPNRAPDSPSIPINGPFKDLKTGSGARHSQKEAECIRIRGKCLSACPALATSTHFHDPDKSYRHVTTVDILPDDILLEIFGFILSGGRDFYIRDYPIWTWHRLVHVCRRWRQIIFTSPIRLDLQLLCTYGTPVKRGLGYWPAFPLVIDYDYIWDVNRTSDDEDNIFIALKQRDRVRHINLSVSSLLLEELFAVMKEPFPALTYLELSCVDVDGPPVFPSEFLGGSARLHEFYLDYIPFPGIPTLLSLAADLVKLRLEHIPPTSLPSPEVMVACLATLTRLEDISIGFLSPTSRPDQIRLPPKTWVLPAVTTFSFDGDSAYLEDFMTRINTPLLNSIDVTYTEDVDLRVTELSKFIERSNLRPSRLGRAKLLFQDDKAAFLFYQESHPNEPSTAIQITEWEGLCAQVTDMTLMLSQLSAMLSDVVHLEVESEFPRESREDDRRNNIGWLELFHPFVAVETLRIYFEPTESVANAFGEMPAEMATQVLPALKSLHLEGPYKRTVEELSNTFRAYDRPIVITSNEVPSFRGSGSKKWPVPLVCSTVA